MSLINGKIKKAYLSLYFIARVFGVTSPKIRRTNTVIGTARTEPKSGPRSWTKRTAEVAAIPTFTISFPISIVAMRSAGFWRNLKISSALLFPSFASLSNLKVLSEKKAVSEAEKRAERRTRKGRRK